MSLIKGENKIVEDAKWIYESPDKGKTVYKRKIGSSKRILVNEKDRGNN